MRKLNAILSMAILLLFIVHAVFGSLQLAGLSGLMLKPLGWLLLVLVGLHMLIGIKLTVDSLQVWKRTGVAYFKENKLFWARRLSGFAIMLLIGFHLTAFGQTDAGVYRLQWFSGFKLATQLLLVLAIAVHVITNVRPMLISFGVKSLRQWVGDILFVLSLLLVLMAAAFIIYYLRWNL